MDRFCVYCHTNKINGKKYFGQTKWIDEPQRRWGLNGNGYKRNKHFWDAICKYGWDNFSHEILETNLTLDEANELETKYICENKTYDRNFGYNLNYGGGNDTLTEETKLKISIANSNPSIETRQKISEAAKKRVGNKNSFYNKHHSEETKNILREKAKNREHIKGYHLSEETKKNISKARIGIKPWNAGMKGVVKLKEETKQKIGEASKKRWQDEEYRSKMAKLLTGQKRSDEFKQGQAERAKGNTNVRGYHWYNNGVELIRAKECPDGFVPGVGNLRKNANQYSNK